MWFRAFGSRGDDLPLNMTASKDGGYLLTLLTTGGSTITKINSRGIILWARAFSELFIISGPVEDMAGHVYIAGTYYNPYDAKSIPDLAIVKMTPGGQVIWKKQLGNPGKAEVANALTIHAERIVLAATNEEYMPVLAELDTGGKLMWVRTFGLTNVQNVSLTSTKDQGIAFISQAFNNEDFETAMFRLDSRGRIQSCALDHSASFQIKKAHFSSSLLTLISNRQIKPRVASRPMKLRKVNLNVTRPCP
jgi:hypothetical protein